MAGACGCGQQRINVRPRRGRAAARDVQRSRGDARTLDGHVGREVMMHSP